MNYAATLAVLMVLAFMFPLLVRFGGTYGFGRTLSTTALMVVSAFGFAVWSIRARVTAHRARLERLLEVRARIERDPRDPRAYFLEGAGAQGEHVGLLLLSLGRRREAGELIERYARLPRAQEAEVAALRAALARAERRRRRSA